MLENEIFKRRVPDYKKLIKYGFTKENDEYKYKTKIMDNFEVRISVKNDKLIGKIYDLDFDEEYTNFRVENQTGEFVNKTREEYSKVLNDIAQKCFIKRPFITDQANRIYKLILDKYKDEPVFKWEKYPDTCVYENNGKWYAAIMYVDRSKFSDLKGETEIIDLKLNQSEINVLLKKEGFYKAYHMNKKNWITIVLDDTLDDNTIMDLIDESYSFTIENYHKSKEWVMPLNPKFFDIFEYFDRTDTYYWDKRKSFKKDDIIYMYVTKPIGSIMYKCKVDDITEDFMIIKRLCKYEENKYNLEVIRKYGLTSVRSPRHIPIELKKYIEGDK